MKNNFDSIWLGLLCGLLCPSIAILIFYLVNFNELTFANFIIDSVSKKLLSPLLSLCAVINLGVFYIYIHFEKYYSARGVILATFVFGIAIVFLKFVI